MKHTIRITVILIILFFLSQIIGLATVSNYIKVAKTPEGKQAIQHGDTILGKQPELKDSEKKFSAIPLTIAILIGTAVVLLLIRFRLRKFWRIWYLISVWITLAIFFDVYLTSIVAVIVALILALLKTFKPNIYK